MRPHSLLVACAFVLVFLHLQHCCVGTGTSSPEKKIRYINPSSSYCKFHPYEPRCHAPPGWFEETSSSTTTDIERLGRTNEQKGGRVKDKTAGRPRPTVEALEDPVLTTTVPPTTSDGIKTGKSDTMEELDKAKVFSVFDHITLFDPTNSVALLIDISCVSALLVVVGYIIVFVLFPDNKTSQSSQHEEKEQEEKLCDETAKEGDEYISPNEQESKRLDSEDEEEREEHDEQELLVEELMDNKQYYHREDTGSSAQLTDASSITASRGEKGKDLEESPTTDGKDSTSNATVQHSKEERPYQSGSSKKQDEEAKMEEKDEGEKHSGVDRAPLLSSLAPATTQSLPELWPLHKQANRSGNKVPVVAETTVYSDKKETTAVSEPSLLPVAAVSARQHHTSANNALPPGGSSGPPMRPHSASFSLPFSPSSSSSSSSLSAAGGQQLVSSDASPSTTRDLSIDLYSEEQHETAVIEKVTRHLSRTHSRLFASNERYRNLSEEHQWALAAKVVDQSIAVKGHQIKRHMKEQAIVAAKQRTVAKMVTEKQKRNQKDRLHKDQMDVKRDRVNIMESELMRKRTKDKNRRDEALFISLVWMSGIILLAVWFRLMTAQGGVGELVDNALGRFSALIPVHTFLDQVYIFSFLGDLLRGAVALVFILVASGLLYFVGSEAVRWFALAVCAYLFGPSAMRAALYFGFVYLFEKLSFGMAASLWGVHSNLTENAAFAAYMGFWAAISAYVGYCVYSTDPINPDRVPGLLDAMVHAASAAASGGSLFSATSPAYPSGRQNSGWQSL